MSQTEIDLRPTFYLGLHKELWEWKAKNPDDPWPGWATLESIEPIEGLEDSLENHCFACGALAIYTKSVGSNTQKCANCPFGNFPSHNCLGGLYNEWRKNKDYHSAMNIAHHEVESDLYSIDERSLKEIVGI